eukprot:7093062-Alexandrium_andersonii.AAC.1
MQVQALSCQARRCLKLPEVCLNGSTPESPPPARAPGPSPGVLFSAGAHLVGTFPRMDTVVSGQC